jgi:hypothetical protein
MPRLGLIPKEAMVKRIGSAYAGASRSIASILRELNPESYTESAGGAALARIRSIVEQLNMRAAEWARRSVKAAYQESRGIAETRLEAIGAQRSKPKTGAKAGSVKSTGEKRHNRAIAQAVKRTTRDYLKANRTILVTAGKYLSTLAYARKKLDDYREASIQAFTAEAVKSFIQKTVAGALVTKSKYNAGEASLTSKDIAGKIRGKLLDQIGGGDFIIVNGKNYNLKSYAELVARTRMRESQTQAVMEICEAFDNDLVQIDIHDDPCSFCAEHQGRVFSISGNSLKYPKLPDGGPPFHPRCECTCGPTSETALRWRNK